MATKKQSAKAKKAPAKKMTKAQMAKALGGSTSAFFSAYRSVKRRAGESDDSYFGRIASAVQANNAAASGPNAVISNAQSSGGYVRPSGRRGTMFRMDVG